MGVMNAKITHQIQGQDYVSAHKQKCKNNQIFPNQALWTFSNCIRKKYCSN